MLDAHVCVCVCTRVCPGVCVEPDPSPVSSGFCSCSPSLSEPGPWDQDSDQAVQGVTPGSSRRAGGRHSMFINRLPRRHLGLISQDPRETERAAAG